MRYDPTVSRRSGRGSPARSPVACLLAGHHYGEDHGVGGGIRRRVCARCGAVTIDLTGAEEMEARRRQILATPGSDR